MGHRKDRIIVLTRYPEPGKVKTRLIPALGPKGSSDLHRRLTEKTMETVRQYQQIRSISAEVRYEGGSLEKMARWLGSGIIYRPQSEGDLGSRMEQAFLDSFRERSHRVLLIGSDCPGLDHGKLEQAFEVLKRHDLVLGPSFDGGYYLIGIKKAASLLFAGISWGTDRVLSQTHRIAGQIGLKTFLLDPLADIDRPEDLSLLKTVLFPSSPSLCRP